MDDEDEPHELTVYAGAEGNPTNLGFPPTLPLELAAKTHPIKVICEGYGISHARYLELCENQVFLQAVADAKKYVEQEGGSFKAKIKTMAEALLPRMLELAQAKDLSQVPASVQADLIKSTIRIAGLDASIDQKGAAAGKAVAQQVATITINFRGNDHG